MWSRFCWGWSIAETSRNVGPEPLGAVRIWVKIGFNFGGDRCPQNSIQTKYNQKYKRNNMERLIRNKIPFPHKLKPLYFLYAFIIFKNPLKSLVFHHHVSKFKSLQFSGRCLREWFSIKNLSRTFIYWQLTREPVHQFFFKIERTEDDTFYFFKDGYIIDQM